MSNLQHLPVMSKRKMKAFSFSYPLKNRVVRNLRLVTVLVGYLQVEGIGYFNPGFSSFDVANRYEVDIEFVKWKGTDIKPVLEVTGDMDEIEESAIRHFASMIEQEKEVEHE